MASVAAYVPLTICELPVDVAGHGNHHPRDFLLRIFVTGEVTLHMAVRAFDAERSAEGTHGLNNIRAGRACHNF